MNRRQRRASEGQGKRSLRAKSKRRSCGACTVCCTTLGVEELKKPPAVACPHVGLGGCSIYPERPKSCAEYVCLWRAGFGTEAMRPDKFGIVLDLGAEGSDRLVAREVHPGAAEARKAELNDLSSQHRLLLLAYGSAAARSVETVHVRVDSEQRLVRIT